MIPRVAAIAETLTASRCTAAYRSAKRSCSAATQLSPTQCHQLLDTARGNHFEALYRITLSLGLRLGEVCGLRWADVDLEARTVRVIQSVYRHEGKLIVDELKTPESRRPLPLSAALVSALKAQRAASRLGRLAAGERWRDSGLVFTSHYGTPLEPRNVQASFKRLLQAAELPPIRFHDLRHSAASLLIVQGHHARVSMELLGHSEIGTSMDVYGHVRMDTQHAAVDDLDRLFLAVSDSASHG